MRSLRVAAGFSLRNTTQGFGYLWKDHMVKECDKKAVRIPKRRTLSLKKWREGFTPVEFGLLKEEALKEAQRCLGLKECESCEICSLFCPDLCITRNEESGEVQIDLEYCKGCGICASVCPKGAIKMVLEDARYEQDRFK